VLRRLNTTQCDYKTGTMLEMQAIESHQLSPAPRSVLISLRRISGWDVWLWPELTSPGSQDACSQRTSSLPKSMIAR